MPRVAFMPEQRISNRIKFKTKECRRALAEHRIRQNEVAQAAGVSKATVSNQLAGKSPLSLPVMLAIEMLADERRALC